MVDVARNLSKLKLRNFTYILTIPFLYALPTHRQEMASATRQACGQNPPAFVSAPASPTASSTLSQVGDANNPGDEATNTPLPTLLSQYCRFTNIHKRIADL